MDELINSRDNIDAQDFRMGRINNFIEYKKFINIESGGLSDTFFGVLFASLFRFNTIMRFLLLLRTCEYYKNCKHGRMHKLIYLSLKFWKSRVGIKLGFSIPENVFDYGLQIPHYGTIVVNSNTSVGKNCRIHVCTNIGASGGSNKAPRIGDNVYIAPGVKIYGDICIGSNNSIAANAAVGKSFKMEGVIIGGVPAKLIRVKS